MIFISHGILLTRFLNGIILCVHKIINLSGLNKNLAIYGCRRNAAVMGGTKNI